jgi:hypothetical protein
MSNDLSDFGTDMISDRKVADRREVRSRWESVFETISVSQERDWLVPLLVGLGVYTLVIVRPFNLLDDADTLWHIVAGEWILEHHNLPFHDPFSHTVFGSSWVPHEWLAEIAFAGAYDWLGWGGIIAGTGLATGTAFALLTRALQTSLGPRRAAIGAALAFMLTEEHLLARPHILALPLLVMWMSTVVAARDKGRVPSLALLPVMALWSNLHGGFVVGLLFAGLLAGEAVLAAPITVRWGMIRGWGTFLALSALAALITPNGLDAYALPLRIFRMGFMRSALVEWQSPNFQQFDTLEVWIMLAVFGGFSLGLRLPWMRTAMLLLLLHLALSHARNAELLGIIGSLLVAAPLSASLGSFAPAKAPLVMTRLWSKLTLRLITGATAVTVLAAIGFLPAAVALDQIGVHPPDKVAPVNAVEAARKTGLSGRVFNSYGFGGYLIFVGISTFVDGRADLFGDSFLERYHSAYNAVGNTLPELLEQYEVTWTLLEPSSPAATLLDHIAGWERVYTDAYAVIHRRNWESGYR